MRTSTSSWLALGIAIVAWGGALLFAWIIVGMQADRAQENGNRAQETAQQTAVARSRALAQDTLEDRTALDTITKTDVLTAVNMIEGAGLPFGVKLRVRDAQGGVSAAKLSEGGLSNVAFTIEAEGSFSALMQAAHILEMLPLLTSLEELDIAGTLGGKDTTSSVWHLTARIRFYTSAAISS